MWYILVTILVYGQKSYLVKLKKESLWEGFQNNTFKKDKK